MMIKAAKIGAPFGLQGGLHLYPYSGQRDHLLLVRHFYASSHANAHRYNVKSISVHGDHLRIFFDDYSDRTAAEKLVGLDLFVKKTDLPQLAQGQYYWHQLEGLCLKGVDGSDYGTVSYLYNNGPQDILVSTTNEHIPFILGVTVADVDLHSKIITLLFDQTSYDASPENE